MASVFNLLILSTFAFRDALQPLVNHKNSTGIRTLLIDIEQIYSNPAHASGRDEQEKIKLAIASAYKSFGIRYALLVGDVDRFPVRYVRTWDSNIWGHSFGPSDLYYADLYDDKGNFSTWDKDNNGLFGEMNAKEGWTTSWAQLNRDQADLKPDIAVGRLPVSTAEELTILVRKIIDYETAGATSWKRRAMLVTGDFENPRRDADNIGQKFSQRGYQIIKHYYEDQPDWNDTSKIGQRAGLLNTEMNSGFGFVIYLGDGAEDAWVNWYRQSDVGALNNSAKLPIILAASCSTAAFTFLERTDGMPYYVRKDGGDYGCKCEDDAVFRPDATFKIVDGTSASGFMLQSFNFPDHSVQRCDGSTDLCFAKGNGIRFKMMPPQAGNSLLEFWRSLRSYNYPDRYLRHQCYRGELTPIISPLDKMDATFRLVPGLADSMFGETFQFVSFESWNYPGWYLKDENGRLVLSRRPTCDHTFDCNATFKEVPGLADRSAVSLESYCRPGCFIRHRDYHLFVESGNGDLFKKDATFIKFRPQHDPIPDYVSLRLAAGDLYVVCSQSEAEFVASLKSLSTDADRIAASFRKLPGLASPDDQSYVSFEALVPQQAQGFWRLLSYGAYYLRHQYFHLKVYERRQIHLLDRPQPAAIQPDRFGFDGLGEEFLVKHPSGAIAYIGSYTGVQRHANNLVRRFAEELSSSSIQARLGDVWNGALRRYIANDFRDIDAHLKEGDWYGSAIFGHVHKMMLFGDPSLQITSA
ncbi:MAG: C25 family cysteine peptidase [Candidatus Brocadiaceae bacterium]|nr:C25 family cysteine peptidase [Candidatus Brocadiaceae bacterium]